MQMEKSVHELDQDKCERMVESDDVYIHSRANRERKQKTPLYNKSLNERIEQIRKSHASARPTSHNPSWLNTHNDLSVALAYIDELERKLKDNGIC